MRLVLRAIVVMAIQSSEQNRFLIYSALKWHTIGSEMAQQKLDLRYPEVVSIPQCCPEAGF